MEICKMRGTIEVSGWKKSVKMGIVEKKQVFSHQGMKSSGEIGNLMWTNAYIPGDVMQNSIGLL